MRDKLALFLRSFDYSVYFSEERVSLANYSYWKIGGEADSVIYPKSIKFLEKLIVFLKNEDINYAVVGKTSNLLFDSDGYNGVLIDLTKLNCFIQEGNKVIIGGGFSVPWLNFKLASRGLSGTEHTVGIPGTIGGLVFMNGGSNRKAIGDNVISARCINTKGEFVELFYDDCKFAYRQSFMQEENLIVVEVTLSLVHKNSLAIKNEMLSILRERRAKFPLDAPSCGSVFKSDAISYELLGPPGKIIEDLGLKGSVWGGIQVSNKHANFFVNIGSATSSDVILLVERIRSLILEKYDIKINTEVKYLPKNSVVMQLSDYLDL